MTDSKQDLSNRMSRLFAALAHPARARIVQELAAGQMCVNTMAEILEISHSSVSQHLAILRGQRLIKEQKQGRFVFYRLVDPNLAAWIDRAGQFASGSDEGQEEAPPAVADNLAYNHSSYQS